MGPQIQEASGPATSGDLQLLESQQDLTELL